MTPDIKHSVRVLRNGGLILLPTDTIWAIGCDATNEQAVERLYMLKNKRCPENLIVLIDKETDISKYTSQKTVRSFDYLKGVTKPITVIYDNSNGLPDNIRDEQGAIAIRVVKDSFVISLIQQLGRPILSATANIEEKSCPFVYNEIDEEVKNGIDYIVKYRREETIRYEPSVIIKWNEDGSFSIIRP